MTDWATISLTQVSAKPQYGAIAKGMESPVGPLFVRQTDITRGAIDWSSVPYCDLTADAVPRYALKQGDLLISRLGNGVGNAATVPQDREDAVFAGYLVRFQIDETKADPRFVGYQCQSQRWRDHVSSFRSGAAQPTLNAKQMGEFRFPLPPIEEQRAITATLGALDDKIESNRRAISLANELSILELSSGDDRVRLGDVATINKGLSYKGSGLDDGTSIGAIPMLNLASFTTTGELKRAGTKWYTGEFKPRHRLEAWDLVIANTDLTQAREILGRGFLVPSKYEGALHTHHTSVVRFSKRTELAMVLWAQIQSAEFRDRAKGFATGTTVAALPPEAALDYELKVPNDLNVKLAAARQLIEKAWQLEDEIGRLKGIRDALLPELLSGRIRVPVEEV